jgi:tRNA 2-selenouridine synthase
MPETLDIESFLNRTCSVPIVDVRSPGEFAQGHIPGAVNIPLFSDAERAEIGTLYVQQGRHPAVLMGLSRIGPRLAELGEQLVAHAKGGDGNRAEGGELLLHCWRGGMRSASVAWLAETLGCRVSMLVGGYKSYRRWAIDSMGRGRQVHVVAGLTGSGKTVVLPALAARGESIIDLEKLAHHKGSAFGDLGEEQAPTQEQFENDLAMAWRNTRPGAPVWMEDESRNIGKCLLPEVFWQFKKAGVFHVLELPEDARLQHLVETYSGHPADDLIARIEILRKRLGGERTAAAVHAVRTGEFKEACRLILGYYDRSYRGALLTVPPERLRVFHFDELDPTAIAEALCDNTPTPIFP